MRAVTAQGIGHGLVLNLQSSQLHDSVIFAPLLPNLILPKFHDLFVIRSARPMRQPFLWRGSGHSWSPEIHVEQSIEFFHGDSQDLTESRGLGAGIQRRGENARAAHGEGSVVARVPEGGEKIEDFCGENSGFVDFFKGSGFRFYSVEHGGELLANEGPAALWAIVVNFAARILMGRARLWKIKGPIPAFRLQTFRCERAERILGLHLHAVEEHAVAAHPTSGAEARGGFVVQFGHGVIFKIKRPTVSSRAFRVGNVFADQAAKFFATADQSMVFHQALR